MISFTEFLNECKYFEIKPKVLNEADKIENSEYQHILNALNLPSDFTFFGKTTPIFHKGNKWNLFCSTLEFDEINNNAKYLNSYENGFTSDGKHKFISFRLNDEYIKITTTGSRKGAKSTDQKENSIALLTSYMFKTGNTNPEVISTQILDFTEDLEKNGIFLKGDVKGSEIVDYIINTKEKNFLIAYNSAKSIYDTVLGSGTNKNLEVHRESNLFIKIKGKAQKLYGTNMNINKWNPSDIFVVKSGFENELDSFNGDIYEYNDLIDNENNRSCWGFSLKDGKDLSLHGSAGLSTLEKYIDTVADIKKSSIKVDIKYDKDHNFLKDIEETVKNIFKKYPQTQFLFGKNNNFEKDFYDFNKKNKKDESKLKVFANNWNKMLSFIAKYSEDLKTMISYSYNYAHSTTSVSCPHWKVYGFEGEIEKIENKHKNESVDLLGIRVYLNGSTAIFFDIQTSEGKKEYAIKERDKGTIQFEIYNAKSKEGIDE